MHTQGSFISASPWPAGYNIMSGRHWQQMVSRRTWSVRLLAGTRCYKLTPLMTYLFKLHQREKIVVQYVSAAIRAQAALTE